MNTLGVLLIVSGSALIYYALHGTARSSVSSSPTAAPATPGSEGRSGLTGPGAGAGKGVAGGGGGSF